MANADTVRALQGHAYLAQIKHTAADIAEALTAAGVPARHGAKDQAMALVMMAGILARELSATPEDLETGVDCLATMLGLATGMRVAVEFRPPEHAKTD